MVIYYSLMVYPTSLPLNPLKRNAWHGRHKGGKKVFASLALVFLGGEEILFIWNQMAKACGPWRVW